MRSMIKVLVIGSNSYIGKKFREYIEEMNSSDISVNLVSAIDGSWRKEDFSYYDVVLHLAAIVHIKETSNMEKLYNDINHLLAVDVAQKAKDNGVKQFVFMSTAAVYGQQNGCITRETIPMPTTFYGRSKLLAEKDIMKLQDNNYQVVILRPPMVYGEGCKGNYMRLVKLARFTRIFPEYHNKRSMINIDYLCKYMIQLIQKGCSGYYHPQDDKYADTCVLIVKLRQEMGKETILFRFLNIGIKLLIQKNVSIFRKMFGDLYYDKSLV